MLFELGRRTRRYWYVVLVGGLASLALGAAVLLGLPASYEASRSVLFVPSPTSEDARRPVNPFFSYLNEGLNSAISVVSIILNDERTQDRIAPEGSGIDYTAEQSTTTTAPVLDIAAKAPTSEQANDVADQLVQLVASTLVAQQRAARGPQSTWIRSTVISSSVEPERVWDTPARLAAIVLALGLLATYGIISLLWRRWQRRQSQEPLDAPPEPPVASSRALSRLSE